MAPDVFNTIRDLRDRISLLRQQGKIIGFIPTMGALHAGHAALIDAAKRNGDVAVVSIFVNPIQFNNDDDYQRYARTLQADLDLCETHAVEIVFAPAVEEMYPAPQESFVDVPEVSKSLCGEFRPGHFRGVATVVTKLFNIVQPHNAYFGGKDAQQLAVIRRMASELNVPVAVHAVPTVREPDGLAMSSRNQRLTPEERKIAPILYRALQAAKRYIDDGQRDAADIKATGLALLGEQPQIRTEYFEIVDAESMQPTSSMSGPLCIAAAAWLGSVRLIDNIFVLATGEAG